MKEECLIHMDNIEKKFAGVYALKGVSLKIAAGEVRCLAGENGCGKSTLIKVLSGVYQPDGGKIFINGFEYPDLHPIEAIKNGIQVIYQDFSLFPNLSVAENITYSLRIDKGSPWINYKEMKQQAQKGLDQIGVYLNLDSPVSELSVADKQLVAIARSLTAEHPRLIIMDEPTTALTHYEITRLLSVISTLKSKKIAIIFVSHKLRELMEVSDTITIMRNGTVVAEGPITEFNEEKISYHMTGKNIVSEKYKGTSGGETLLKVKNLSYRNRFQDISFELKKGDIIGITGLLGCGRSEIAECLFGILPPDRGEVILNGKKADLRTILGARAAGIGYVPEDRLTEGLFLSKPILNNIIISIYDKLANVLGKINFREGRSKASAKIKELKLNTENLDMPVQNLSGGNQQRVVIAKWLVSDISLLVLNGPTVGVDVGSKFEIHSKLKEIAAQGIPIIIISDDVPELLENCNRILMIYKGRLVSEFSPENETVDSLSAALLKEYDNAV